MWLTLCMAQGRAQTLAGPAAVRAAAMALRPPERRRLAQVLQGRPRALKRPARECPRPRQPACPAAPALLRGGSRGDTTARRALRALQRRPEQRLSRWRLNVRRPPARSAARARQLLAVPVQAPARPALLMTACLPAWRRLLQRQQCLSAKPRGGQQGVALGVSQQHPRPQAQGPLKPQHYHGWQDKLFRRRVRSRPGCLAAAYWAQPRAPRPADSRQAQQACRQQHGAGRVRSQRRWTLGAGQRRGQHGWRKPYKWVCSRQRWPPGAMRRLWRRG